MHIKVGMTIGRRFLYLYSVSLLYFLWSAPYPAVALEGLKFVAQRTLSAQLPTAIVALDKQHGFVAYDEKGKNLVFMNSEFVETGKVDLAKALGYNPRGLCCLTYDLVHERIKVFDPGRCLLHVFLPDGKIEQTISLAIAAPDSISSPTSMAVDSEGVMYIADPGEDDIKAFSSDGTYLFSIHLPLDVEASKPRFRVTALGILRDGTVVAIDSKARNLVMFSREGRFLMERPLEGDFAEIKKILVLESDELMGFDNAQKVFKWTSRGKQTAGLGTKGTGRGQFSSLADITCDVDGNVVVLDSADKDVQIFAFDSPSRVLVGQIRQHEYQVNMLTSDGIPFKVVELLPDGAVMFDPENKIVILQQGEKKQEFKHKELKNVSVAHLGATLLYVFDRSRQKVFAFRRSDCAFDFSFGEGRLGRVGRILPAPGKTLLFADDYDTEIKVFSEDGILSTRFGKQGKDLPKEIGFLRDITWHKNQLAVLDSDRNMVHIFSPNGSFVRNINIRSPIKKVDLAAIGSDPEGFLLILDRRNSRIMVVDDEGKVVFQFGSQGNRAQDWKDPADFLVGTEGVLRLLDSGTPSRLLAYRLRTAGPLSQAELSIADSNWNDARNILDPYLSKDFDGTPNHVRAMRLALDANTKSEGKFLTKVQAERAVAGLQSYLHKNPSSIDERLALAANFRQDKRLEDAIAVLRAGQNAHADPRYEALLADYAKDLEKSGDVKSVVSIVSCETPPIMGAIYQSYHDTPIIQLTLSNDGGKATPRGTALFFAKAVMDNPTETEIPPLKPFSTATVKLKATFNRNILTYVQETRISAQVQVSFGDGQSPIEKNFNVQLLGRNSINWAQEQMVACFVTPKDQDVQMFARQAIKMAGDLAIQSDLDANLYKALTLFDAMQSLGLYYMPDPIQPFNFSKMSKGDVIDYVQFPRETLLRQSGDCDDLSTLYASLLEGVGIPALMVTSPGHIFTAFKLEKGRQAIDAMGLPADLLFQYKGDYYVPVEPTLLGNPFISAWRMAANTITRYGKENKIVYIELAEAWKTYQTVSLPPMEREMPMAKTNVLAILLRRELDALNLRQVEKRLDIFKRWLDREPRNMPLLILLSRSYAEIGLFEQAEEYAIRAQKEKPDSPDVNQVLGNIAYMQNDCQKAVQLYQKADSVTHTAALQINMALACLKGGQLMSARKAFAEARKLDAKLVADYPELAQLLE